VLTLKAAGLVDVDAGEIVRPGILGGIGFTAEHDLHRVVNL
jgi:hypothetical protein